MKNLTKPQIIILGVVGFIILLILLVFLGILPGLKKDSSNLKTNLEFWGVFDNSESYGAAIADFKNLYPGVTVNYRRFQEAADYEAALLDALASGKGPDIAMVRNVSLPREAARLVPAPNAKVSLLALRNLFPQVVEADFAPAGAVYALPLSLDSLALIYNQDIFNENAITAPPATWEEFKALVPRLTRRDETGKIVVAAAALGGSRRSIPLAPDILSALMLQTGTKMVSDDFRSAEFASAEGENALNFYTQFSRPKSALYTWDDSFAEASAAFAAEKAAMTFGYARSLQDLKLKNPFLNFGVTALPQPQEAAKSITYPAYWGYAVTRQSLKQNLAWDFIVTLTTKLPNAQSYLEVTGVPPALRSLISEKLNDPNLSVFAAQSLTARSWPQVNPEAVGQIFSQMIEKVNAGTLDARAALEEAERLVTDLMQRRVSRFNIFPVAEAQVLNIWRNTGSGGPTCNETGTLEAPVKPCNFCDGIIVAGNIITLLFTIAFPITVAMVVYGAIRLMISGGSPEKVNQAKKIMTNAIIGLVIVLAAWVIVNTLLRVLVGFTSGDTSLWPWSRISCS